MNEQVRAIMARSGYTPRPYEKLEEVEVNVSFGVIDHREVCANLSWALSLIRQAAAQGAVHAYIVIKLGSPNHEHNNTGTRVDETRYRRLLVYPGARNSLISDATP